MDSQEYQEQSVTGDTDGETSGAVAPEMEPVVKEQHAESEKKTDCCSVGTGNSFRKAMNELILPRGMVGAPYDLEQELCCEEPFKNNIRILGVSNNEIEGLTVALNREKNTLYVTGTPRQSGTLGIRIEYLAKTFLCSEKVIHCELPLIYITPDPKSMWKNLPTDPEAPYQIKDQEHQFIAAERNMVAASKRGRSHAHEGKFRDDNFRMEYIPDYQWYIVAVSDGAGSAEFSREGSRIACDTFCQLIKDRVTQKEVNERFNAMSSDEQEKVLMNGILKAAYQGMANIHTEAQQKQIPIKKFSATLLGYVLKKLKDEWLVVAIGIGDGVIGLMGTDGELHLLSEPDGGEFVGQTRFITMNEVWQDNPQGRVRKLRIKDFKAILSMSDGVSDPRFETDNNLKNPLLWQELWDDLSGSVPFTEHSENTAQKLEDWLDFWAKGHHDDRTIAIVY